MSFVTRCPACATHFRVVSDQLKISDGWVRCGQCGEVFDASFHLAALPPTEPGEDLAAAPTPTAPAGALIEPSTDRLAEPPAEHNPASDPEPPVAFVAAPEPLLEPSPIPEPPPEPIPEPESIPESEPAVVRPPERQTGTQADVFHPQEDPVDSLYDLPPAAALLPASSPQEADELVASKEALSDFPEQVGFVRQAQRRAWWQRPAVRWSLALVSLLLCVGLLLQWVVFERDRIAALRPDLQPALNALCKPLGCRVEPLRWVQALSIDSTTLARRGNGRYALEVVLRNASVFELAMPALELSLTDVRDQLLLRRVILPADVPAAPATVPANNTLTLRVDVLIDGPAGEALAGYRTLVFYP